MSVVKHYFTLVWCGAGPLIGALGCKYAQGHTDMKGPAASLRRLSAEMSCGSAQRLHTAPATQHEEHVPGTIMEGLDSRLSVLDPAAPLGRAIARQLATAFTRFSHRGFLDFLESELRSSSLHRVGVGDSEPPLSQSNHPPSSPSRPISAYRADTRRVA